MKMIFNNCRCHISTSADMAKIAETLKKQKRCNSLTALYMGLTAVCFVCTEVRLFELSEQIKYLNRKVNGLETRKEE